MSTREIAADGLWRQNPAFVQLLGLCPLLAVTTTVVNALGLALATGFVLTGSSVTVSALRRFTPDHLRLPIFVLIIATLTTVALLLMQAFAYTLYARIALFVQIIVTNCVIFGRAEAFASKRPLGQALADGLSMSAGFALALVTLGIVREVLGRGTLFADLEALFGDAARGLAIDLPGSGLLLAALPPGAFIVAGLLLALKNALTRSNE